MVTVIINPVSGGATPEQARLRADLAARVIAEAVSYTHLTLPTIDLPARPTLKLLGIAEDAGPDGPTRTAIVSDSGAMVFVKEGDAVSHFRVTRIAADVVEFTNVDDNTILRLALK